ncbi:MAG: hypothetical protein AAF849_22920 [Bacteroidota bacterium]
MTDQQIDRLLNRLERTHQDELKLVHQLKIDYFETDYLEELYIKWQSEHQLLLSHHKKLLIFTAISPIWLILSLTAEHFQIPYLNYTGVLFPLSIFAYLNILFFLYKRYGSIKQHDHTGNVLQLELMRRRDRMYI